MQNLHCFIVTDDDKDFSVVSFAVKSGSFDGSNL